MADVVEMVVTVLVVFRGVMEENSLITLQETTMTLMGATNFLESLSKEWKKTMMLYKDLPPLRIPSQGSYFAAFM